MTTYYLANDGNDSADGLSPATPWQTINHAGTQSIPAGATIALRAGDIFAESNSVGWNGTADDPILVTSYHDGDLPIITGRREVVGWDTGGNWTDEGGNVWSITHTRSPGRLWTKTGTDAYLEWFETDTDETAITDTRRWYHDTNTNVLYLYATSNPSSFYTGIDVAQPDSGTNSTLGLHNVAYLHLLGLDLRGGNEALKITAGSQDVIGVRIERCRIGADTRAKGIESRSESDTWRVRGTLVTRNVFDNTYPFSEAVARNFYDGYRLHHGTVDTRTFNNDFQGAQHNEIYLRGVSPETATRPITGNWIYENRFRLPAHVNHCRAFSFEATAVGYVTDNHFYRNRAHGFSAKCAIGGNLNTVWSNVMSGWRHSNQAELGRSQVFSLEAGSTFISLNNTLAHNTIIRCTDAGIRVTSFSPQDTNHPEGHTVANNLLYECGQDAEIAGQEHIGMQIEDNPGTGNTYRNNLVYSSTTTTTIRHFGTNRTVAAWNAQTGTNNDTVSGNLSDDPVLARPNEYREILSSTSPAIDAGVTLSGTPLDVNGRVRPQGTDPDIGAYEAITGTGTGRAQRSRRR